MSMNQLFSNQYYKVVKVEFDAGESMTNHSATTDAFIVVQKGKAEVTFKDRTVELSEGSCASILANEEHTLKVIEPFSACIVFGGTGKIEFA